MSSGHWPFSVSDLWCVKYISAKKYSAVARKLDTLIDALDARLSELVTQFPELGKLIDAIDEARALLEREGLLGSQYETRKQQMMLRKRAG